MDLQLLQASETHSYADPGAVAWLPEDDEAIQRIEAEIDYALKNGLSSMQGQIQSYRGIEHSLAGRWMTLRLHFSQGSERSTPTEDRRKWNRYYTTTYERATKLEYRSHCFYQIAKAISLSLPDEVLSTEYTTASSEHNLSNVPPTPCTRNAIISFRGGLCALSLNIHAEWDHNRFEVRREVGSNALKRVPRSPEIVKDQALEQSEILFQQLMQRFDGDTLKVGDLSMIWQIAITNTITKYTILKAHRAIGKSSSCWCQFTLSGGEVETRACQNLIATDNGRVGMRLLADHPKVFRNKDIQEIFTFPAGSLPGLTFWVMVFKLG
ncbi:hypothetical protein FKW77_001269 [Venturia effusa]|uniref:Uncharacterized protein n=1 Tax=Venturia effusa TaxID=50376 RepID=A0A517LQL2_9PEZI|nr:hypothetical protein FKW77_001269 [Venturia effusa]